ncbi:MAG: 16S rRNA (cytidine(1402)-2'-O)-methyltransferase [Acidobacteria bacterium]|nr:16S rRNA (cytidine(1402)-2'-O)-methyltransferase [Acidobacteriota bacterium]MCI0721067.1 16S rRNA (cytidine(1402)-2'-O)-methyltransferase [Acidobacteriota bacterium]
MPGTLYVVATPIGNLEDITLRALRVLREVDLIACEDTRHTARLLSHYEIRKPTTSYHEHNEIEKAALLLEKLEGGKQIALVSDAGTPCISDPGYRIVRQAQERRIPVVPIPGPCSFIAALSASGRASDAFSFLGFLPARKSARAALLNSLKDEGRTLIFFESPERLLEAVADLDKILGPRPMTIAREITKVYEELFSGTPQEGIEYFAQKTVKGEIVLIVEPGTRELGSLEALDVPALRQRVVGMTQGLGMMKTEAVKRLAREMNISRRELYRLLVEEEETS